MPVTLRVLLKMRGMISTPTLNDLAVRNGDVLNLGSSPMEILSAASEPLSRERLRLPSSTFRPRACEAFSSMVGRNLSTGIKNGAMTTIRIKTTNTTARMRRVRFMTVSSARGLDDGLTAMIARGRDRRLMAGERKRYLGAQEGERCFNELGRGVEEDRSVAAVWYDPER